MTPKERTLILEMQESVVAQIIPLLDAIQCATEQCPPVRTLIRQSIAAECELEFEETEDLIELRFSLLRAASRAATANGLPPCLYSRAAQEDA